MSLATVYTRAHCGVDAPLVSVETHLSNGLPALGIVGLPETAVRESKDRVRSALLNSHFEFPNRRITINLAPADLPKEGGRFDLAIALGILAASGQIPGDQLQHYEFLGELALNGQLRGVQAALPAALRCAEARRQLVVPRDNSAEAALCDSVDVLAVDTLLQLCAHLHQRERLAPVPVTPWQQREQAYPDLAEVQGQPLARRALEIAAAGGHNLLLCGPPGTGKTMLASRLPGILPPLSQAEMIEVATIRSLYRPGTEQWQRPFRSPHHTASAVAMVGGGSQPRPGEISLAHRGVLFLDELPEFQRQVLEVLREPMESGEIMISRARQQIRYPASFQLVAAMNPCPCGYYGDPRRHCRCTPNQLQRYRDKVSGPLLDRIDLQVQLPRLPPQLLRQSSARTETSAQVQQRVVHARQRQLERYGTANAQLNSQQLRHHCALQAADQDLLEQAVERLQLSPRAYYRVLRVARTIADLTGEKNIGGDHITEALGYRALERE